MANSLEPTADESVLFVTLQAVFDWAGLAQITSVSLASFLGAELTSHPRSLAMIADSDWVAALAHWRVAPSISTSSTELVATVPAALVPPSIFQLGQAGLVGSAIRIAFGTQMRHADVLASQAAVAVAAASVGTVGSLAAVVPKERVIDLSQVIDQQADEKTPLLDEVAINMAYQRYTDIMGDVPGDDVEPSRAQLTALYHLVVVLHMLPYVDFAIWGPHQIRTIRKLKFSGLILSPTGSLINAEVNGPSCFEQWDACMAVFITALVMLDICNFSSVNRYREHIRNYHARYSSKCWPLIYQADVRARRELCERVRRDLTSSGKLVPGTLKPWDMVFKAMPEQYQFWKKEVEDPAIVVVASMASGSAAGLLASGLGEAPLASHSSEHIASSQENMTGQMVSPRQVSSGARVAPKAASHNKRQRTAPSDRSHSVNSAGYHVVNRNGHNICLAFQNGTCSNGSSCNDRHQCSRCLDNKHGAHHPNECAHVARAPSGHGRGGRGKGKGGKSK
jgi:hypothetical protein